MIHGDKPLILTEGTYDANTLHAFIESLPADRKVRDIVPEQLAELYKIEHPERIFADGFSEECRKYASQRIAERGDLLGDWVYYPWSRTLLHTLSRDNNFLLRTNRNRNLITPKEGELLRHAVIGIAGLSVGGHIALGLTYGAIGGTLKLAEYDTLDTTNLNRVRAGLADVGQPKCEVVARQIYEVDPHADIRFFRDGLREETLDNFLGDPAPRLIFEAIDDFKMKIRIRLAARRQRIPVVMFTALGDNILIDVERYDRDGSLPLFHGLLDTLPEKILADHLTPEKEKEYALAIVGKEHVPDRARASVAEIGRTLVGRPQLAGTVFLFGGLGQYVAKQIILPDGHELSGRTFLSLERFFCP